MDKLYLSFEDSTVVANKVFASYSSLPNIIQTFQVSLESLSKANQHLKAAKETIHRVSMTTFLESIVQIMMHLDKNYDQTGRHLIEEKIHNSKTPRADKRASRSNSRQNEVIISPLKLANRFVQEDESERNRVELKYSSNGSSSVKTPHMFVKRNEDKYLEKIREKK